MRTLVVVVWVHFFASSVIFLMMMVGFLQVVVAFSVSLLMTLLIYLVSFHGGRIAVSEALMMLMLLILSFRVVFGGE